MPALLEATSSTSYGVAEHAAGVLAHVTDPDAVPLLIDALVNAIRVGHDTDCRTDDTHGNEIHL